MYMDSHVTGMESERVGWLVVLGLTTLWDSISVYIGPSPKEREKEERKGKMRVKTPKQPPPAPTTSAVGPCSTVIQIVGRPGTGSLPSTIAPPDLPQIREGTHGCVTNVTLLSTPRSFVSKLSLGNPWVRQLQSGTWHHPIAATICNVGRPWHTQTTSVKS